MTHLAKALAALDAFVAQQMAAYNTPGVAIGLTDRTALLHVGTYGYADLGTRALVTPDTLFEIGSIGKSFTSLALQQLREAGTIDLHAPVTDYLPWFAVRSTHAPITLHHLLTHSAGLIMGTDFTPDARSEVWALREIEAAPPGEHFHYSNVGYKALGLVLERVLGSSYAEILPARILQPLGMSATDPVITLATRRRLATGYGPFYDDRPPHPPDPIAPATWLETATADGCLASTPADMAAYVRMLLNQGAGPADRLISEESFDLMTRPWMPVLEGIAYGYGLGLSSLDDHPLIEHGGGMVGYRSTIMADVDYGLGVVVLINGPGDQEAIARFALRLLRAARAAAPLPAPPPVPDPTPVENAAGYTGTYQGERGTLTLAQDEDLLILDDGPVRVALEPRGPDRFYVQHPAYDRFLLYFGRDEGGQVVEAWHGPDWFANSRYRGPATFAPPAEWAAYPGHYRAHNPWFTNFRVVLRKGELVFIHPSGTEVPLVPLGEGRFRLGHAESSADEVRFDNIADGQALHAWWSCGDFYRFFTP